MKDQFLLTISISIMSPVNHRDFSVSCRQNRRNEYTQKHIQAEEKT